MVGWVIAMNIVRKVLMGLMKQNHAEILKLCRSVAKKSIGKYGLFWAVLISLIKWHFYTTVLFVYHLKIKIL